MARFEDLLPCLQLEMEREDEPRFPQSLPPALCSGKMQLAKLARASESRKETKREGGTQTNYKH